MRLNLTLPGFGGGGGSRPQAPEPPAAPPPPPKQVDARRELASRRGQSRSTPRPANIRNEGGQAGQQTGGQMGSTSGVARALKNLTGQ